MGENTKYREWYLCDTYMPTGSITTQHMKSMNTYHHLFHIHNNISYATQSNNV